MQKLIAGKALAEWQNALPLLGKVCAAEEVFWVNPGLAPCAGRVIAPDFSLADIEDAALRLQRFAPLLALAFPETAAQGGIIESALLPLPKMQAFMEAGHNMPLQGHMWLKNDAYLPIAGSVKARGGIYEVLQFAEQVALQRGLLQHGENYEKLLHEECRRVFAEYTLVVGSTGNLGLSIGISATRLGFRAVVHMSADAKEWKKNLLREKGATVVEHAGDYGAAVAAGRKAALADPKSHFVDDENSASLFLGYAVAALRLQKQFAEQKIVVDADHPLFVYLPCGVGGAPGGIAFGLRTIFGDAAHCFFAEPVQAPAMLLGLMTGKGSEVSVEDFGLTNRTAADGLAVGRPSALVCRVMHKDISGVFTVEDFKLYRLLNRLADNEGIWLEPSALAAFRGPFGMLTCEEGRQYLRDHGLESKLAQSAHLLWATGGGLLPRALQKEFYSLGK